MATFDTCSSPSAHLAYSREFFAMLTFKNVAKIEYRTVSPPKSVTSWTFANCVPINAHANIIALHKVLPHTEDLLPAFSQESRSAVVTIAAT